MIGVAFPVVQVSTLRRSICAASSFNFRAKSVMNRMLIECTGMQKTVESLVSLAQAVAGREGQARILAGEAMRLPGFDVLKIAVRHQDIPKRRRDAPVTDVNILT